MEFLNLAGVVEWVIIIDLLGIIKMSQDQWTSTLTKEVKCHNITDATKTAIFSCFLLEALRLLIKYSLT